MRRLLLDQGLPRSSVDLLRADGWDVEHVFDCGLSKATDQQILDFARQQGRVICTLDADFHALLAVGGHEGPSVVRIRREGLRAPQFIALLKAVWSVAEDAIARGAVVSVTDAAVRVRRLPLGIAIESSELG